MCAPCPPAKCVRGAILPQPVIRPPPALRPPFLCVPPARPALRRFLTRIAPAGVYPPTMLHRLRLLLLACLLTFLLGQTTAAWSFKEHILVTRLAVQRLLADASTPEEMKAWLREASPAAGDATSARTLLVETYVGPEPVGLEKL